MHHCFGSALHHWRRSVNAEGNLKVNAVTPHPHSTIRKAFNNSLAKMIVFFMIISLLNCFYYYEHRAVSDPTFCVISAFLLLMYYHFFLFFRDQWHLRVFRGPFAMPFLGNCYQPGCLRSLLTYLAGLRKQYGKIFTLQVGICHFSSLSLLSLAQLAACKLT